MIKCYHSKCNSAENGASILTKKRLSVGVGNQIKDKTSKRALNWDTKAIKSVSNR
jgi:hypothetical protein